MEAINHTPESSKPKRKLKEIPSSNAQVKLASQALDDKKAVDIVYIPLESRSTMADALVIATGTSATHVQTLADNVAEALEKAGARVRGVEGREGGWWVLVDTGDIVVHIFQEEARDLYRLERLWGFDLDEEPENGEHPLDLTASS